MDKYNSKIWLYVLFLINTGLRKGEMLALTWGDLLDQEQRVRVNKSLGLKIGIKKRESQRIYGC